MFSDSMMLGGSRKAAFSIPHSVRLDGVADHFSRTMNTPTNQGRWTFSLWFKRAKISASDRIQLFGGDSLSGTRFAVFLDSDDSLRLDWNGQAYQISSRRKFRDTTSWYHLVLAYNGSASANQDRLSIWVNGQRETDFASFNANIPSTLNFNNNTPHYLGTEVTSCFFDGYYADIHFIDGQALDPSTFGAMDPITGSWQPKVVDITVFGNNGYHLDFNDPADLGRDVSGQGNHWTSVSLGAADVVADTPTNNYATFNRLNMTSPTGDGLSSGNTLFTTAGQINVWKSVHGNVAVASGKWYREYTIVVGSAVTAGVGVVSTSCPPTDNTYPGISSTNKGWMLGFTNNLDTNKRTDGGVTYLGSGTSIGTGDTIMEAVDLDAGKVWWGKNGTWFEDGEPASGVNAAFTNLLGHEVTFFAGIPGGSTSIRVNNGQRNFTFTPPAGFKSLCTANLPKPTIQSPAKHFDVVTYTGTGAARSITGLGFQPDLVWIKNRGASTDHRIYDSVRGAAKQLYSNSASQENTSSAGLSSFNADGFSLFAPSTDTAENANGNSYVAWCWKAGGEAVANTNGTIPSLVSANPAAGFSIVSYTGTLSPATIGHGLGASPKLIIVKSRTIGTYDWTCQHASLGPNKRIWLNLMTGADSLSNPWNGTVPTASVFSVGTNNETNTTGPMIAYCWAEVPGFSSFGSYTGNGSTDGPFVQCGFRPRWVMIKRTDTGNHWALLDTQRRPFNPAGYVLEANTNSAENGTGSEVDVIANGFKIRNTPLTMNANGGTYIYAAFAEAPFGGRKTTPAKAR